MGCGSACSDNFVLSMLPTWNQNFFFRFRAGKFSSAAPNMRRTRPLSLLWFPMSITKLGLPPSNFNSLIARSVISHCILTLREEASYLEGSLAS